MLKTNDVAIVLSGYQKLQSILEITKINEKPFQKMEIKVLETIKADQK